MNRRKKRIIVYNILFFASNREINTKYQIYFRKQQSSLHQIGKLTPNNKFILENNKSNVKNAKDIYICLKKKEKKTHINKGGKAYLTQICRIYYRKKTLIGVLFEKSSLKVFF